MLLDVSMPVTPGTAPFPGDEPFSCGWSATKSGGAAVNVGWVKTSPHVGTHVDAPFHYDDAGHRVGGFDLEAFVGACVVVDARGAGELGADLLRGLDLRQTPRVLFRTQEHRSDPGRFIDRYPVLTREAVDELARNDVRLVGIDAPSFDLGADELPIHHALGRARIANVENLVLDRAPAGRYELLAQPLSWNDLDAAPLRALLRK